jgi:hypothetical protein
MNSRPLALSRLPVLIVLMIKTFVFACPSLEPTDHFIIGFICAQAQNQNYSASKKTQNNELKFSFSHPS